jgi:predicted kinase
MRIIIYRGLPGAGKSTAARKDNSCNVIEADDFFMINGEYRYDTEKSIDAHMYCRSLACLNLFNGNDVAVANTFITQEQLDPYIDIARRYGASLEVVECTGTFSTVHNVPEAVIDNMKNNWEDVIVPDDVKFV